MSGIQLILPIIQRSRIITYKEKKSIQTEPENDADKLVKQDIKTVVIASIYVQEVKGEHRRDKNTHTKMAPNKNITELVTASC